MPSLWLYVGCGSVTDYEDDFDCAVGLHSCGSLTDLALAQVRSSAYSHEQRRLALTLSSLWTIQEFFAAFLMEETLQALCLTHVCMCACVCVHIYAHVCVWFVLLQAVSRRAAFCVAPCCCE